jgi:non-specific serine/threonine protein kinase
MGRVWQDVRSKLESAPVERWTFGDFVLDLEARELLRAGTPVPLSPKALQLLGLLAAGQGRALSKTELQERLWPDTFVVEKNLTNLVSEIREALGDNPAHPRFIRTVHRYGYAFLEAPATDSRGDRRHNLPVQLTNFVGRDREIAELLHLAASARLLTLTGAGGCGKTRLAIELAAKLLDRFPHGVWVVDLAALSDPNLVAQTVAATLGLREGPLKSIDDALLEYVRNRKMLVVFDNCEHLIAACAQLAERLLRSAAGLHIVTTSREALGVSGEVVWRIPSLSLPDPVASASAEALIRSDAGRLFVERAAAVDPAFTLTAANAATVAEICQRLDGIPLAIELAAARLKLISIDQIHARLSDRFRLLTGGSRTVIARHRTLEATVDWSYELLTDPERQLLRRLSVFAGGWTLEAAEEVAAGEGSEPAGVLDLLSHLVDKSLVIVDGDADAGRRYRFLETVRQYARERLVQFEEGSRVQERHLACFHALVRRAEPGLLGAAEITWVNRLEREHSNLRAALEWCLTTPGCEVRSVELASALHWFWLKRSWFREGQEYLERALAAGRDVPVALRAKALMALGSLLFFQGDLVRAQGVLAESATLGRAAGQLSIVGLSLGLASVNALELGDAAECRRLAGEGLVAARDEPFLQGPSLASLAYLALQEGDLDEAGRLHEQVLERCREQGDRWALGINLFDLALLRVLQQRHAEARALSAEGIAIYRESGDPRGVAWCLGILSAADAADGHPLRAARLRGAMEGLLESVGAPVQDSYSKWIGDRSLELMQAALGDDGLQAALAEGRGMSLTRAIEFGWMDAR